MKKANMLFEQRCNESAFSWDGKYANEEDIDEAMFLGDDMETIEETEEIEEDPTQQDFDIVPAQAPIENPTLAEAPVKTYPMEDGSMLECYGDNDRGFEIRHNGRKLPTRFPHIDHADMAVKLFQKRRQRAQAPDQDYMEEH